MEKVLRQANIGLNAKDAFDCFVLNLNDWWPREYTWSRDTLKDIGIDARTGGLCTEIGPDGFRCDWGRVTQYIHGESISFTWQIGPNREPVPDPKKASRVTVDFDKKGNNSGRTKALRFREAWGWRIRILQIMGSDQGWKYILECYRNYCSNR